MYQFAIIGCGNTGFSHAEKIAGKGKLVAVCDTVGTKADALAKKFDAKPYYSIEELLSEEKNIQVVVVCTPNGYHAEHCIKALQAGKHVLCESPMCLTTAAAWQTIETEKFCRKKLFVTKANRYNHLLTQVKKSIEQKDFGTIYSFQLNCFSYKPTEYYNDKHGKLFPDGGLLFMEFSSYVDLLLWFFGAVKEVSGYGSNLAHKDLIEYEDTGIAAFKMVSGILGGFKWSVNYSNVEKETSLIILTEKGTLHIGGLHLDEIKVNSTHINFETANNSSEAIYDHLIQALNGSADFATAFDGLHTVETIEKIYKALNLPSYHSF